MEIVLQKTFNIQNMCFGNPIRNWGWHTNESNRVNKQSPINIRQLYKIIWIIHAF